MKRMWGILLGLLLALAFGPAVAQDAPPLRDLADARGLAIGTAGNSWNFEQDPRYGEAVAAHFNLLTPENEAKWCQTQRESDQFDFRGLDFLVSFAQAHDMRVHAHVLVWHNCFPDWLDALTPTRDEAIALLRDHIYTVVGRYRGRMYIWDVVNEAIMWDGTRRQSRWQEWIGDDYIELAFRFAHQADPSALLFYNDYNAEGINAKSDGIYALMQDFTARGVPVDGVGLQMHVSLGEVGAGRQVDPVAVAENMRRLGALGLQVQITEMDVAHQGEYTPEVARQQASIYAQIFQTCLQAENCTGFSTWGVSDGNTWLRLPEFFDNPAVAPLLLDEAYQPKPAYAALQDALLRDLGRPPVLTDADWYALLNPGAAAPVELPPPIFSDPSQLAPDSVNGLAYYAAWPVAIGLDGDDADWVNIPRDTLNTTTNPPDAADNTRLVFAAAADDRYFYFLGEVNDSRLVYGQNDIGGQWWQEDSVEFYLNTTGDLARTAYAPGIVQIAIPAVNLTDPSQTIVAGNGSDSLAGKVEAMVVQTEGGYRVEARVPLRTDIWNIIPAPGLTLGFQVHLNGSSGSGRDVKWIWSLADTQDQSYRDPSVFGRVIFWPVG